MHQRGREAAAGGVPLERLDLGARGGSARDRSWRRILRRDLGGSGRPIAPDERMRSGDFFFFVFRR
jgi:hypothetical protein